MNITIARNINQELERFKFKIQLMSKGIRIAIVCFIIGILAIIVCQNDFGVTMNSTYCYLFLELILFSLSLIITRRIYNFRKVYKTFSKSALAEYTDIEIYSTITIDDSFFVYQSPKKYYKISWPSFIGYKFQNGHLILMINEGYSLAFIIQQNEPAKSEFAELYEFVSKKITLIKK